MKVLRFITFWGMYHRMIAVYSQFQGRVYTSAILSKSCQIVMFTLYICKLAMFSFPRRNCQTTCAHSKAICSLNIKHHQHVCMYHTSSKSHKNVYPTQTQPTLAKLYIILPLEIYIHPLKFLIILFTRSES